MKAKMLLLCSAIFVPIMVIALSVSAISVSSPALAGGNGTAVDRVLHIGSMPTIEWVDDVVLGGYYYNSELATVNNTSNVPCDIMLRGADAIMAVGSNWQCWQELDIPPVVNRYNLGWIPAGSYTPQWLHVTNAVKIANDVPKGSLVQGRLHMRTPAVSSNTGNFTIPVLFTAVAHSEDVSP